MCSSELQEELASSLSGPALGTRKRSVPSTFTFDDMLEGQEIEDMKEGGKKDISDSDDDFVVEKKKKINNSKIKKSKGLNKFASSSKPDVTSLNPPENYITIELQLKKEDTSTNPKGDYQCNQAVERPVIIATPEQINSRSFDQEEILTPSICSNPMEEKATDSSNIVKHLVEQVVQAQTSVTPGGKTSEEMKMNTLPPKLSSNQLADSTLGLLHHPSQPKVFNPQVSAGHGRVFRPANPLRAPSQARQFTPGTRPPLRPSGPRMLRPLRPSHPKRSAIGGPPRFSQFAPRLGGLTGGSRLPNIKSATPIKRRSLSTPQSSQYNPPVVELDDSPPRPDQDDNVFHPPTNSVVNKLTSLGVSVAMEKVPTTKQGWEFPPGLSITRAPSTVICESPSTPLTSLANAFLKLGDVQGRTRLVQYQLSERQVKALQALGVRESGVFLRGGVKTSINMNIM